MKERREERKETRKKRKINCLKEKWTLVESTAFRKSSQLSLVSFCLADRQRDSGSVVLCPG